MIEFFRLKKKCSLGDFNFPDLAAANFKESFTSIAAFGNLPDNALTFFDGSVLVNSQISASNAIILVHENSYVLLKKSYPRARLVVVADPRAVFIEIVNQSQAKNLLCVSSDLPNVPNISPNTEIGKNVIIEDEVQIDDGVQIGAGAIIKRGSWLKRDVVVGENTVIGSVGINLHFSSPDGARYRFPHIAGVIIEDCANIGANCVVVRGTLRSTLIGSDSTISNLCNIGHCVSVGSKTWISSGVIIGGYCTVGSATNIGIGAIIKNGISIGEAANIGMGSVVLKSVDKAESVFGNPARKVGPIKAGPN